LEKGATLISWHRFGRARLQNQAFAVTRGEIGAIILGTIFLFVGLAACTIAAIRGRRGVRILVWQGIFSGMYGARLLATVPAAFDLLPRSTWASRQVVVAIITYLILPFAVLFWMEMSTGALRRVLQVTLFAASLNAVAATVSALLSPSFGRFMAYNHVVVVLFLLPLAIVNAVPGLAERYMLIESRILTLATSCVAWVAVYNNLKDFVHLPYNPSVEPVSFAVFVLLLGYVAADKVFRDERRLLALENELAIAREIQASILPSCVPEINNLRIYAAYRPMTAVAGDFYDFIVVDQNRAGFLVADVSGHGVPAALIASMIKVAVQSVVSCAHSPCEVLGGLNSILTQQLHDQFVSAAYLWLDTENHRAWYSAAGHPPLLHWREGKLERIESNGFLFGFAPDSDYPICDIPIKPADRFVLYTDGVTEPENAKGESFGDHRLEEILRQNQSCSPSELADELIAQIGHWRPASTTQQDDITLIVVDVV
jgi:phosphoserine phosphatase RsbU/P